MRILVTGGAGFIGSHLCERLLNQGHEVLVIDDLSTGNMVNLRSPQENQDFVFYKGSILDEVLIQRLIRGVDYVFHLAAAVGVFNIVRKPIASLVTNIRGTENVLAAASEYNIPVFITSSSEVYGKNASNSLRETDDRLLGAPTTLRWSYSEAKAVDESLAMAYYLEKNLETRIVRFFNTVGPRQLGTYGMVVPRFVSSALRNEPITIYGDGTQTRCFAHVHDVIDAVMAVAFAKNTIGRVINIGNNSEISIFKLAQKIIEETKSESKIKFQTYQEAYGVGFEDMERRVPCLDLIKELVGWTPQRDLSQIISDISLEMEKSFKEQ